MFASSSAIIVEPTAVVMDALKRRNPHNRDARITFEPVEHKYFIDGGTNPDAFTSVTTWVHSHFEVFNADAVIDKMMASKSWATNEKYRGKSKDQIKAEWDLNRDRAAAAGTDMHAAIELYYNNNVRAAAAAEELKGGADANSIGASRLCKDLREQTIGAINGRA